jgi:hypothetical protein
MEPDPTVTDHLDLFAGPPTAADKEPVKAAKRQVKK